MTEHLAGQSGDQTALKWPDFIVLIVYFTLVIGTGIVSSMQNRGSIAGYFLGGQRMSWWLVGLSLFASNIGSGHFVGLGGSAASSGVAIAAFELHAVFVLVLLGWVFAPVYKAAGVYTLPEYLYKRFGGGRIRMYLAVLSLLLYVFTKISADLYSGALFLTLSIPGLHLFIAIGILIAVAAVFTITGGLTAVIWTDAVQTFIMIVGAVILMVMSFMKVGGFDQMVELFPKSVSDTWIEGQSNDSYPFKDCGRVTKLYLNIMRPVDDTDYPWTGLVFGLTVSALWYWCTDQVIVQRVLAAKDIVSAKMACVLASYLKVTPLYLIVFPGMIARILFPNRVGCNEPDECEEVCGSRSGCTNIAYPLLVLEVMPTGLRGLLLSVMMSALVSSLTSVFNSTATIFTIDVWSHLRKAKASDMELMIVGRLCVVGLVVISVLWVPVIQASRELFHYIQGVTAFLAPPVCAVFVIAVFWERMTEPAAFWGLIVGLLIGLVRFVWQYFFQPNEPCGLESESQFTKSRFITELQYLHFGAVLFGVVVVFTVLVSFLTPKPPEHRYKGKTFSSRREAVVMAMSSSELLTEARVSGSPRYFQDMMAGRTYAELPRRTKLCLWLCGVEDLARPSDEAAATRVRSSAHMSRSVHEPPSIKYLLHLNAFLAVGIISGIWIYFS